MFAGAQIIAKGDAKNGAVGTQWAGLEWDTDKIKSKNWVSMNKDLKVETDMAWNMCKGHTIAYYGKWNLLHPLTNADEHLAFAGSFKDTGVQYGLDWGWNFNNWALSKHNLSFYFNHVAGANIAGAHVNYDHDSKAFKTTLGLQMDKGDHTWKMRWHQDGMMHTALQWQMHKTAKATLNTKVNLRDIPAGKVASYPPLNLTVEIKF